MIFNENWDFLFSRKTQRSAVYDRLWWWVKIVFAILASAVSFGISHLIFVISKYKWAHRAYIAAVAANRENPGEEYAKAWIGFQEEGRKYKSTVKVLETTAKIVKNLESILADYIEEEFEVREYDLRYNFSNSLSFKKVSLYCVATSVRLATTSCMLCKGR